MSISGKIGSPIIATAIVISSLLILGTTAIAEIAAEKSFPKARQSEWLN